MLDVKGHALAPEVVVYDICHAEFKTLQPNGKGELSFRCPIHSDKWVEINMRKGGVWKCFRECSNCTGEHGGGLLEFSRLFFNCNSNREVINMIADYLSCNEDSCKKRQLEIMPEIKQLPLADPDTLHKTYSAFLDMLILSEEHLADLKKRGMKPVDIEAMGFKSIPQNGLSVIANNLISDGNILRGVPGFYEDKDSRPMVNCHGSGYFIPYRDAKDRIVGMQIRYDIDLSKANTPEEIKKLKSMRYRAFTSSGKPNGTAAITMPFFGIPRKTHRNDVVYITEGGLKAATAQSLSNGWFTAIPGVSTYEAFRKLLYVLKEQKVSTVVDAFDSDRNTNQSVANAIEKLHKIAKEEFGIEMKSWDWGTEYKGVDDFLLAQEVARRKTGKNGMVVKHIVHQKEPPIATETTEKEKQLEFIVPDNIDDLDFMAYLQPPTAY